MESLCLKTRSRVEKQMFSRGVLSHCARVAPVPMAGFKLKVPT